MTMQRCAWVNMDDPLYIEYHDQEWGAPIHDDRLLFEFLILEGFQAGLSWRTILHKREHFRQAFDYFDPRIIAAYNESKLNELLSNPGIIRNRLKILAAVSNAQAFLKIQDMYGSFDAYLYQFVGGKPIQNAWESVTQIPAKTYESDLMSQDMKKRGFKFVGSTICYAHMQATGMVNDHTIDCFRYQPVRNMGV